MLGVPQGEAGAVLTLKDGREGAGRVTEQGGLLSKQGGQHVPRQRGEVRRNAGQRVWLNCRVRTKRG